MQEQFFLGEAKIQKNILFECHFQNAVYFSYMFEIQWSEFDPTKKLV